MSRRYEILDILAQDSRGVAFHAMDHEMQREVVLRRFFPFGAAGGGLIDEEKTAYETAVQRLMAVSHPALRNVLDGGTDPNDGMPFVVTEWLEGEPLSKRLAERPLSPPSAKALLDLALQTCQILSETFQEEHVWIETSTTSILIGPSGRERQVTFRISPLRWLGEDDSRQGLRSVLRLAEEATGWNRRMLPDSAGDGLGAWVKALRKDPDQWTIEQARYALHHGVEAIDGTPSRPATPISPAHATIPAQTTPPAFRRRARIPWWLWSTAASLLIAAGGIVLWQVAKGRVQAAQTPAKASSQPTLSDTERASARAAELAREIESLAAIPASPAPVRASPEQNQHLIEIGRKLRQRLGQQGEIKETLLEVRASTSGKTLYLEFGSSSHPDAICARYHIRKGLFTEAELRSHIGKRLRIQGRIVDDHADRIAIDLATRDGLTVVDG